MNRPPYMMRLKVNEPGHKINLWLPLFLLFPLLAVVMIILLPFLLLAALLLWPFGWGRILLVIPAVFTIMWALRGLEVQVEDSKEKVHILVK